MFLPCVRPILFIASIFSVFPCFAENILKDPEFKQGFNVMSPIKDIYTDRAKFETIFRPANFDKTLKKDEQPPWRLVQWGSAKSLAKSLPIDLADGGKRWSLIDKKDGKDVLYKSVVLKKDNDSLVLELNALPEFSATYLTSADQFWPHLLMVQNLKSKKLDQYHLLSLELDARLLSDEKNIREGYKADLHAARFVVSMAVHNTLSNNNFWLNMVVYDDRYPQSGFLCQKCRDDHQQDCYTPQKIDDPGEWLCPFDGNRWSKTSEKKGTRRMIFRLPTAAATQDNIQDGEWVRYRVDLLPYIKAGLEAAQGDKSLRGFLPSLKYCDITLFSMGWEVTGLNHAAMEVKNLSLTGL